MLSPNRSLSWRGNKIAWMLIATPALLVAGVLAAQGLWPVLPCAGAEVLLLFTALYLNCHRQHRSEQVALSEYEVALITAGEGSTPELRWPKAWTRIRVQPGPSHWYAPRLFLEYCGQRQEIGANLSDQDKAQLLRSLVEAGLRRIA